MRVERGRLAARLDTAEAAATGAGVAHKHDGGRGSGLVGAAPALANVGTPSLLAYGVKVETAQVGLDLGKFGVRAGAGDGRLEPFG